MNQSGPANILLVDDQQSNLLALEAMLTDLGQNLVQANSGTEALRRILEREFALILLDIQMPEMDGYETARLIRERDRSRHIPIIFVTAHLRTDANVFRGYALGAVDYLFKPIVPEVLRSKVQFFVELYQKNQEIRHQAIELAHLIRQNQLIVNSVADGMLGSAPDGTATFVNPAAARMLGRRVDDILGQGIHGLLHPTASGIIRCPGKHCRVSMALTGQAIYDVRENVFWRSDGMNFPVEFSVTPMANEDGDLLGYVMTFRDITEKRAAAQAMENERRYREAEAASRAKDDFLATLSHELRTPMTAILGWTEILAEGPWDEALGNEAVDSIRSAARHQAQLIDDMLDMSRIILGKFNLDLSPVLVGDIVRDAVDTVRPSADAKEIGLSIDCEDAKVLGDAVRLKQVFWNLLTNAIKFSDPGGQVEVTVRCNSEEALISVRDDGPGIEPRLLPIIFDRLRQGEAGKRHGGLGLGLAIVRHIVEAHNGVVEVQSEGTGKGATFSIRLPLWKGTAEKDDQEQRSTRTEQRDERLESSTLR